MYITLFNHWTGTGAGPAEVKLPAMRKVCNDFYHPASVNAMEDLEQGQHSLWIQIGSKLFPEYPIRNPCEAFYQLSQTVKKPYAYIFAMVSYMQIHSWHVHGKNRLAGSTGLNTKAGDMLIVHFRGCNALTPDGSAIDSYSIPTRVFCTLHYDAVLNVRDSGVELLD